MAVIKSARGERAMSTIHQIYELLRHELGVLLSSTLARLVLAAVLGGLIGLERQVRRKPAGLRTNMFICFGAAMFTLLSRQLSGNESDYTRIASQIIPGIGFIGAGSILHAKGSVTGLTTAATLFVVASVGMASGGGLYLTACFATAIILIALELLGHLEGAFSLKTILTTYEVSGRSADSMLREVNRILDTQQLTMQSVHMAGEPPEVRVVFTLDCDREEQNVFSVRLHESNVFTNVSSLGTAERE
jgi:putative Mg2+ transporter-C (MgtC) family protein